jgi:hypothetical protein
MSYVTILPSPLYKKPTRDELVGLFYNMLFTDLAPFLSMMPEPIGMPLDDAEYPLCIRDLTGKFRCSSRGDSQAWLIEH